MLQDFKILETLHYKFLDNVPKQREQMIARLHEIGRTDLATKLTECSHNTIETERCKDYFLCPLCQLFQEYIDLHKVKYAHSKSNSDKFAFIKFRSPDFSSFGLDLIESLYGLEKCFQRFFQDRWYEAHFNGFFRSFSFEYSGISKTWTVCLSIILSYNSRSIKIWDDPILFAKKGFLVFNGINNKSPFCISSSDTEYITSKDKLELLFYSSFPFYWDELRFGMSDKELNFFIDTLPPIMSHNYEFGGDLDYRSVIKHRDYFNYD